MRLSSIHARAATGDFVSRAVKQPLQDPCSFGETNSVIILNSRANATISLDEQAGLNGFVRSYP